MAVNRQELIDGLNELIQTCNDGSSGFRLAAENVEDPDLRVLFRQCSDERAQFAAELEAEVLHLGGDPAQSGSVSGTVHRGWTKLKSAVTRGSDDAIIAECERGEDAALAAYRRVLKNNLPPRVMPVVKHQFTRVKQVHDRLRDMEMSRTNTMEDNAMTKLVSFLAGCGAGIVAGMMVAPRSGRELRGTVNEKLGQGRRMIQEQGGIRGVVNKGVERGRNVASTGRSRISESIEAGKKRISEAVQAGKREYDQEKNRDFSDRGFSESGYSSFDEPKNRDVSGL